MSLVRDPDNIRLAMLGMIAGNGHPYSWSAIINGRYDAQRMAACGYPVIPKYLDAEPRKNLGIRGVQVTHIWCDDPEDARKVSGRAAFIPNIVSRPEDVIGQVDAVVIPTDKGEEHLDRARPFIEAGLPVFVDKPLTTREDHLRQFVAWQRESRPIFSTSCMRYSREFNDLRSKLPGTRPTPASSPRPHQKAGRVTASTPSRPPTHFCPPGVGEPLPTPAKGRRPLCMFATSQAWTSWSRPSKT